MNMREKLHAMADVLRGAEAMARVFEFDELEDALGKERSACLEIADAIQADIREKARERTGE